MRVSAVLVAGLLVGSGAAFAQGQQSDYQTRVYRLSELLGMLHAVRPVCEPAEELHWYDRMNEMIRLERPTSDQKVGMINRFNAGYASGQRFTVCTDAARAFAASTAREGEAISRALAAAVGN
ncbi:MAG: TIGR02301 family protein [Alphaproteobacteria bacterium]